ncbi:MAG: hypothetical protein JAY74_27925 [Candidatus Thiodiazotropha taylori]|nr:hypothetical protein [Candidatus Thiodiazotropha taylori]
MREIRNNKKYVVLLLAITAAFMLYVSFAPLASAIEFNNLFDFINGVIRVLGEQYIEGPTDFFFIFSASLILSIITVLVLVVSLFTWRYLLPMYYSLLVLFSISSMYVAFKIGDVPIFSLSLLVIAYSLYVLRKEKTLESH